MGLKQFIRRSQSVSTQITKTPLEEDASRTTVSERSSYSALEVLAMDQRWNDCLQHVREKYSTAASDSHPLHTLLTYQAPVAVVDACCIMLSDHGVMIPEEMVDALGRTPLHVATQAGCTVETAERLLAGASMVMPAVTKDARGRYPLHWLCATPVARKGRWQRVDAMAKWNKRQVCVLLLELDPAGAAVADASGTTPLEYAKRNALGTLMVQDLEKVQSPLEEDAVDVRSDCGDMMRELAVRRMHDDVSTVGCGDVEDGIDPFAGMRMGDGVRDDILQEELEPPVQLPPMTEMATHAVSSVSKSLPPQQQPTTPTTVVVEEDDDDDDFGLVEC